MWYASKVEFVTSCSVRRLRAPVCNLSSLSPTHRYANRSLSYLHLVSTLELHAVYVRQKFESRWWFILIYFTVVLTQHAMRGAIFNRGGCMPNVLQRFAQSMTLQEVTSQIVLEHSAGREWGFLQLFICNVTPHAGSYNCVQISEVTWDASGGAILQTSLAVAGNFDCWPRMYRRARLLYRWRVEIVVILVILTFVKHKFK